MSLAGDLTCYDRNKIQYLGLDSGPGIFTYLKLCLATATHSFKGHICKFEWFAKFKFHHISVFQDWKHILLLTTDYTGASKNTECLL